MAEEDKRDIEGVSHVEELEKFADEAGLSEVQRIRLYQIARALLNCGGTFYNKAVAGRYLPHDIEKRLREGDRKLRELSYALMKREDSIGRKGETAKTR